MYAGVPSVATILEEPSDTETSYQEQDSFRKQDSTNSEVTDNAQDHHDVDSDDDDESFEYVDGAMYAYGSEDDINRPARSHNRLGEIRNMLWTFFNEPSSSYLAFAWQLLMIALIILSIIILLWESFTPLFVHPITGIVGLEIFIIAVFTFEYLMRLITCPTRKLFLPFIKDKFRFIIVPANIVDLLSFLPFYIALIVVVPGTSLTLLIIYRVFQLFRVLKVGRYNAGIKLFGEALLHSKESLLMIIVGIGTGYLFFATILFYAEQTKSTFYDDDDHWRYNDDTWTLMGARTQFQTIPESLWWASVTFTTTGYGDTFPVTPWGRFFACVAIICALLLLAFPLSILATKFLELYLQKEERKKIYRKQMWAVFQTPEEDPLSIPMRQVGQQVSQGNELLDEISQLLNVAKLARTDRNRALLLFDIDRNPALNDLFYRDENGTFVYVDDEWD